MSRPLRIAMWSGPRNLSTALMRSFSSRADTIVLDEPFYGCYLKETGIDHPGRAQVLASCETDWRKVMDKITGPIPAGKALWYQKHMAHHMLPHIDSNRLIHDDQMRHAFLIRDPAEVISSYTKVHCEMALNETGLPYQVDLFERVRTVTGGIPPVIDASDLLRDPRRTLSLLCESLGIEFTERMLHWPAGPHPQDGIWAPHWYAGVYASTGFEPYKAKHEPVPDALKPMLKDATRLYEQLAEHKL